MKRIIALLMVFCILGLTGCSTLEAKDSINSFISENEELLTDAAVYGQYDRALILPEIYNVYWEMDCVVFTTGKSGLLTDTRCGFYYSFDGDPAGAGYANSWKLVEEDGGYCWHDNKGRMEYHTSHIYGNFYYFEGTW